MKECATHWVSSGVKILLILGLCLVCVWMGLGRGYEDGTQAGLRNGYIVGFRVGHRTGWHSAAAELGSPELPSPKVYPVAPASR